MKSEPRALSKRPYRDSALVYAGFAIVFVIVVAATGGTVLPRLNRGTDEGFVIGALPIAAGCFLLATGYSWWRIRTRLAAKGEDS